MYHYFLAVDQSETYMTFKTFYFFIAKLVGHFASLA